MRLPWVTCLVSSLCLHGHSVHAQATVPPGLFGVQLGQARETLKGRLRQIPGSVVIQGIEHISYELTSGTDSLPAPVQKVHLAVRSDQQVVVGIYGLAELEISTCQAEVQRVKAELEKKWRIPLKPLEHQKDTFFVAETDRFWLSVGCQQKRKTMFQLQLGQKP